MSRACILNALALSLPLWGLIIGGLYALWGAM